MGESWFSEALLNSGREKRLFCFPHAGGGTAIYHRLGRELSDQIQVLPIKLPGRESRLQERPFEVLTELVDVLVGAVQPLTDRPYALLGHSLGGALAYELATRLRTCPPQSLFISSCRAPTCERSSSNMHDLPEAEMLDELVKRYGAATAISEEEFGLMRMLSGTIRADLKMLETHEFSQSESLACPITALGGADDALVTHSELRMWQAQTVGQFRLRMYSGGHFYLRGHLGSIAALVERGME